MTATHHSNIRADSTLQVSRAVAVVIAAPQGHDVFTINCKEEECTWPLSTPATMIGYEAGQQLLVRVGSFVSVLLLMQNIQQPADLLLSMLHCMRQSVQAAALTESPLTKLP